MLDPDRLKEISNSVNDLFESLPSNGKPKSNEFTVMSAIVEEGPDQTFTVIVLTTGTKCLGKDHNNSTGKLISDSHAEVLAKRAFSYYLLSHCERKQDPESKSLNNLIEFNEESQKYRVMNGYNYHLFISDSPCGDASIYDREKGLNFTGAKPVPPSTDIADIHESQAICKREESQELGILRTKSGKSTIDEKYRTTSMSCSDKLCRWSHLGCLGAVVSSCIETVYFKSIIVGEDPLGIRDSQYQALKRSLQDRVGPWTCEHKQPDLYIVENSRFRYGKCNQERKYASKLPSKLESSVAGDELELKALPCGTSINWIRDSSNGDTSKSSSKRIKYCNGGSIEVTLAHLGALQGAVKRNLGKDETSSRLCRRSTALSVIRQLDGIRSQDASCVHRQLKSYLDIKSLDAEYSKRKGMFLQGLFRQWICDDDSDFPIETNANPLSVEDTDEKDTDKPKKRQKLS